MTHLKHIAPLTEEEHIVTVRWAVDRAHRVVDKMCGAAAMTFAEFARQCDVQYDIEYDWLINQLAESVVSFSRTNGLHVHAGPHSFPLFGCMRCYKKV